MPKSSRRAYFAPMNFLPSTPASACLPSEGASVAALFRLPSATRDQRSLPRLCR
ncbi:hypothetical protein JMJ77_0004454, partial [Colletotrichum scovillei]